MIVKILHHYRWASAGLRSTILRICELIAGMCLDISGISCGKVMHGVQPRLPYNQRKYTTWRDNAPYTPYDQHSIYPVEPNHLLIRSRTALQGYKHYKCQHLDTQVASEAKEGLEIRQRGGGRREEARE